MGLLEFRFSLVFSNRENPVSITTVKIWSNHQLKLKAKEPELNLNFGLDIFNTFIRSIANPFPSYFAVILLTGIGSISRNLFNFIRNCMLGSQYILKINNY